MDKINRHPNYQRGSMYYDVCLMETQERIAFNDAVVPVCLPFLPSDDEDDMSADYVSLGWWEANRDLTLSDLRVSAGTVCRDTLSRLSGLAERFSLRSTIESELTPEVRRGVHEQMSI